MSWLKSKSCKGDSPINLKYQKVFNKYFKESFQSYFILTLAMLGGTAITIMLHGFKPIDLLIPAMWLLLSFSYARIAIFSVNVRKELKAGNIRIKHFNKAVFEIDNQNNLSIKFGRIRPTKYIIKDETGKKYYLYSDMLTKENNITIKIENIELDIEFLEQTGFVLSMQIKYIGKLKDMNKAKTTVKIHFCDYI